MDGKTVSEMMKAILKYRRRRAKGHPLELYAELLSDLPFRVSRFLHAGHHSVVMRLVDGTILKVTGRPRRSADSAVGHPATGGRHGDRQNIAISWSVQPAAESPIRREDLRPFLIRIRDDGHRMIDPAYHNLGYYQSSTVLIDPFAVVELPEDMRRS